MYNFTSSVYDPVCTGYAFLKIKFHSPFRFDRWKAHLSRHPTRYNRVPCASYEPPSYVEDVAANGGVYSADEFVPEDTPAPHFERAPVMINKRSTPDSRLPSIKRLEVNYGKLVPWHPLLKSPFRKV